MAIQTINTGASDDDPSADTARAAFTKVNENFTEVSGLASQSPVAINLLPDAGRFVATSEAKNATTVGSFVAPPYLLDLNGATKAAHSKFITNNTTYGGSAGALSAEADALIQKIRNTALRRYNSEFHIMSVTMGSGTTLSTTISSTTYYVASYIRSLLTNKRTIHFYCKAPSAGVLIRRQSAEEIYFDDVLVAGVGAAASGAVITSSDGWVAVRIELEVEPFNTSSYQPDPVQISMAASGDVALIACMAALPGIVKVPPTQGLIPNNSIHG